VARVLREHEMAKNSGGEAVGAQGRAASQHGGGGKHSGGWHWAVRHRAYSGRRRQRDRSDLGPARTQAVGAATATLPAKPSLAEICPDCGQRVLCGSLRAAKSARSVGLASAKPTEGAIAAWSGGKDSCMPPTWRSSRWYIITHLANTISYDYERVRFHGLPARVIQLQAQAVGIPLLQVKTTAGRLRG
jgi:hypothetical protein